MTGQCQCGGILHEANHNVTTLAGAAKHGVVGQPLPIEVETTTCGACGRRMTRIYDKNGEKIK